MPVEQRECGHGEGEQCTEDGVQRAFHEARGAIHMIEVEAVGEELCDAGGGYEEAWRVPKGEDGEGVVKGKEEGGREAVVGWGGEGEDVDEGVGGVGCASYCAWFGGRG